MFNNSQIKLQIRPFLKWAGGKGKLLSQYCKYFPASYNTYHEPFLGGGAVFFFLLPERAFLSDINPRLIDAYNSIKTNVERVISYLEEHKENHCHYYYYKIREETRTFHFHKADPYYQSATFIYLNKTCFNGLYRENKDGYFNVPLGKQKTSPKICDAPLLREVSKVLYPSTIKVEQGRFTDVLKRVAYGDFVYFDPPYDPVSETSRFTKYNKQDFLKEDHSQLLAVARELNKMNVKFMLSNSDTQFVRGLFAEFNIHEVSCPRSISSKAESRGSVAELVITNY